MKHSISLPSTEDTEYFGKQLGQLCQPHCIIFLQGTLGAGKTTLTRGLLRSLGHSGSVKSPTYTLVESYQLDHQCIYHFDLYRINDSEELECMGIRDYFTHNAIIIVEWPENGQNTLPNPDLWITISVLNNHREIAWRSMSTNGETICEKLSHIYHLKNC